MKDAVIVDVVRSPSGRGKPGGALSGLHPVALLAQVLNGLLARHDVDPAVIDDVITGCVGMVGEQSANIGRNAVLAAGWPESVPATSIDRACGSSQQAMHFAAQGVMSGAYDVVVACGVESMSRVPMGMAAVGADPFGPGITARYPEGMIGQGIAAERVTSRWGFTRNDLDEYAARSHRLAAAAAAAGGFDNEIVGVTVDGTTARADETIRPTTTVEGLSGLKPAFHDLAYSDRFSEIGWHITAGNSSPLTDGAAAALIMTPERAESLGLRPRARFHSFALAGDDPVMMLTAPIPATRKVLARSGLGIADIDAYEVNEAFAPVPLAWAKDLGADPQRLNPRGGAIAIGHPLGASGVRLMATLVNHLEQTGGRYGLQTMCEAGGLANATIVERV